MAIDRDAPPAMHFQFSTHQQKCTATRAARPCATRFPTIGLTASTPCTQSLRSATLQNLAVRRGIMKVSTCDWERNYRRVEIRVPDRLTTRAARPRLRVALYVNAWFSRLSAMSVPTAA